LVGDAAMMGVQATSGRLKLVTCVVQLDTILLSIPLGSWVAKIMPSPYFRACAAQRHDFFSLDALPENTTPGTRARIAEVMLGAPLSERW
jgi:hypothetical protein